MSIGLCVIMLASASFTPHVVNISDFKWQPDTVYMYLAAWFPLGVIPMVLYIAVRFSNSCRRKLKHCGNSGQLLCHI